MVVEYFLTLQLTCLGLAGYAGIAVLAVRTQPLTCTALRVTIRCCPLSLPPGGAGGCA